MYKVVIRWGSQDPSHRQHEDVLTTRYLAMSSSVGSNRMKSLCSIGHEGRFAEVRGPKFHDSGETRPYLTTAPNMARNLKALGLANLGQITAGNWYGLHVNERMVQLSA